MRLSGIDRKCLRVLPINPSIRRYLQRDGPVGRSIAKFGNMLGHSLADTTALLQKALLAFFSARVAAILQIDDLAYRWMVLLLEEEQSLVK